MFLALRCCVIRMPQVALNGDAGICRFRRAAYAGLSSVAPQAERELKRRQSVNAAD